MSVPGGHLSTARAAGPVSAGHAAGAKPRVARRYLTTTRTGQVTVTQNSTVAAGGETHAYHNLYKGIDAVYTQGQGSLHTTYTVSPHAAVSGIVANVDGTSSVHLDSAGNLVLGLDVTTMRSSKPVAHQVVGGARHAVAAYYVLGRHG